MTGWSDLDRELGAWQRAGRGATLWWRDDDAVAPSPALDRLLALSRDTGAPLALAVIPDRAAPALRTALLAGPEGLAVLQHGFAHRDHAPAGRKRMELGPARPAAAVLGELTAGGARLAALFGATGLLLPAVLVPPWNRIDAALLPALPALGYRFLSRFAARATPRATSGATPGANLDLTEINAHVDIMRWSEPRGFAGEAACLGALCRHLEGRRAGRCDPDEPTGLLTHHLVHDAAAWDFMARLLAVLTGHPATRFRAPAALFGEAAP